jgi:hypothetical protein
MTHMRMAEGALLQQVHPAKIGADVTASIISNVLLWRARPITAVAVRYTVPIASSAVVLGLADLDALARTRRGRYVLAHMPPAAQAIRLAGDAVMGVGVYRRNPALFAAGAALVLLGWSHALWPAPPGSGFSPAALISPQS